MQWGLELVDHRSAALPTAPRWNIVIQMTKLIYVNFKSIISNGKRHSVPIYLLRWNDPEVILEVVVDL